MQTIAGFPYFEVQFTKEGAVFNENEVSDILAFVQQNPPTDLFVISHGWNNDMQEARSLYSGFLATVRRAMNNHPFPQLAQRRFAVLGILWPSIKFAEDQLIPGGGAAEFDAAESEEEKLRQQLESLKGVFDHPDADARLQTAKELLDRVQNDEAAQAAFVTLIRSLPHQHDTHPDDASDVFFTLPAQTLVDRLSRPILPVATDASSGGAAAFDSVSLARGSSAGFDLSSGILPSLRRILNFTTYYQMKERAGVVGRSGAYAVLQRIGSAVPNLKLHLIGHSFGGRLVTSLANGPGGKPPLLVDSMTLLQAAFSHNGFAQKFDKKRDGFFRKVITEKKVRGPILITHSIKDLAVGLAYPLASRLSNDDSAEFIGGPNDRFGGMGRNGARFTPEADDTTPLGTDTATYTFRPGTVYNLQADTIINGHSDIVRGEVAHAFLAAVAAT